MRHIKSISKVQHDKSIHPRIVFEGDLVLVYDQYKYYLVEGNFNVMWNIPYIVRHVLKKGYYELVDHEGNVLIKLGNELYLKRY
jgi:hypothetical protein